MLAEIWEDLLGRGPIGIRETFQSLGGDSALAEHMIGRVEQACGSRIPASLRSSDATIEQLARALIEAERVVRPSRHRTFFGRNLERGTGESAAPFFFLHGDLNGGGLYCLKLAGYLGRHQPFYALAPHGLDGRSVPETIEAMAASHLEMMRRLQPAGPYRLGGHCNGALVAFEIARQLRAQGEQVDRLILIGPRLPERKPGALATQWRYYLGRLKRLANLPAREQAAYVKEKLRQGLGIVTSLARLKVRESLADERPTAALTGKSISPEDGHERMMRIYARVMRTYKVRRYSGSITILWAQDEPAQGPGGPARVWGKAGSRLEIRHVPGAHLTCITIHVRALAERLRACLDSGPSVKI
jgi:thioesterase domain-containing protein